MIISSEAIVLHSRKYSETSAILTLYTKEQGKIGVLAKGARRPKSKFGSIILPLGIVDAVYYYKPTRELQTLSNADVAVQLRTISNSYEHLSVALATAEALSITQPPGEKNEELYALLRSTLIAINESEHNVYALFAYFCTHCAELMGFMIDFSVELTLAPYEIPTAIHEYDFSFANGSPYTAHESSMHSGYRLSSATLSALQRIAIKPIDEVASIDLDAAQRHEIQLFFTNYFSYHLERRIVFRTERLVLGEEKL